MPLTYLFLGNKKNYLKIRLLSIVSYIYYNLNLYKYFEPLKLKVMRDHASRL